MPEEKRNIFDRQARKQTELLGTKQRMEEGKNSEIIIHYYYFVSFSIIVANIVNVINSTY